MSGPALKPRSSTAVRGSTTRQAAQAEGSARPQDGGGRTEEATAAACRAYVQLAMQVARLADPSAHSEIAVPGWEKLRLHRRCCIDVYAMRIE